MANRETKLKIVVDAQNNATAGLRGVSRELGGMDKQGSMLAGTMSALKVATAAAAAAIGAAGFNVIKAGANFEQTQIAFSTMLGSAEQGKKTLEELAQFAAKTPFEITQLEDASKRLLAYGTTAEELIPTLRMLGDISAGVGMDKMPQLILAFGQVRAATKLTGMELRQFSETGVPLLGTLAVQLGKTEAEIIEMVSAGEIGFPLVQKALASLTGEGGKFFNLMENQSASLSGLWSNLKDQIELTARALGEKLLPHIKPIVENLIRLAEMMRSVAEAFSGFNTTIGQSSDLLLILRGYWSQIAESFNKTVRPALEYLGSVLAKNKDEITLILSVLGKLLAFLTATALQVAFVAFAAAIKVIANAFDIAVTAISTFIEIVDKTIKKVQRLIELVSGSGMGKLFKGLFDGARAEGGPVSAGRSYLVGEQGPELFRPSTSGSIIPNKAMGAYSSPTIYITGNTFLSEDVAEQVGDMIMGRLKLSNAL